jgi:hypothetical protein
VAYITPQKQRIFLTGKCTIHVKVYIHEIKEHSIYTTKNDQIGFFRVKGKIERRQEWIDNESHFIESITFRTKGESNV